MAGLAAKLRLAGIPADFPLSDRSLSKGMKYASAMHYPYAVIMGEDEWKDGKVTLRDMASGEQQVISVGELIKRFS